MCDPAALSPIRLGPEEAPILVVDDEPAVAEFFAICLRQSGHRVIMATGGLQAVSLLRQTTPPIKLLVTDVDMPELSGIELAKFVERTSPGCPVLLVSGKPLPPDAEGRGWEFLTKPFRSDQLLHVVQGLLSRSGNPPAVPAGEAGPTPRLRVILADDDLEMRERVCGLLSERYDVVSFENGGALLREAGELRPNLILLDISMPDMSGFAVAKSLRVELPSVPILFLTQHSEPAYVDEAFRSGIDGYVLKRHMLRDLSTALEQVRSGYRYVSPSLGAR